MPWWTWFLVGIAVLAFVYAAFVVVLLLAGRRGEARTLATFIPTASCSSADSHATRVYRDAGS